MRVALLFLLLCLLWDATCPDTLAASYRVHATTPACQGKLLQLQRQRRVKKYQGLPPGHLFVPITIETLGAIGPRSLVFLKDLGRRIRGETGEPKSTEYVHQRSLVTVQRGKCAAVLGGTGY